GLRPQARLQEHCRCDHHASSSLPGRFVSRCGLHLDSTTCSIKLVIKSQGVDAGWGRLRRPGGAPNYCRNLYTEPAYLSSPHTPKPKTTSHVAVSARELHNSAGLQWC